MKTATRKRCPKCGNINIGLWMGAAAGVLYRCNNCNYMGPIVIEEDK